MSTTEELEARIAALEVGADDHKGRIVGVRRHDPEPDQSEALADDPSEAAYDLAMEPEWD